MKPNYDYVFVTHLPAFYKVNLYREIAKHCRILVIFIAQGSSIRTADFVASLGDVDHVILSKGTFEEREWKNNVWRLYCILRKLKYRTLVLGGWDLIEFWFLALYSAKRYNALALESSVYDSTHTGFVSLIKRFFLSKISKVFASGTPHCMLLDKLQYSGKICITMGVGIFNYVPKRSKDNACRRKFLYVGRLSPEKNIMRLLDVFRELPDYTLTIVGLGPLFSALRAQCPSNVSLLGYIENKQLGQCYEEHDVFILPSIKEPWGVVVEEALYYGLPVIASDKVGCAIDWVKRYEVGRLFDPLNNTSIKESIVWAMEHFDSLKNKVKQIDFFSRDNFQVTQYIKTL